ncbi:MAG: alpha/beta hydrolase [Promethearchaeia archaeon]
MRTEAKNNKYINRKLISLIIFLLLFLIGTLLIFLIPGSVKITYNLNIKTKDGTTIVFNVYEPNNNEKKNKAAVILGHGIMDSKEWMKEYAIEFAAAGFVAVTLDFRGHGQSSGELNYDLLINDVKAIKDYLRNRGDINMDKLAYLGFSMGGWPGNQIVKEDDSFQCFIGVGTMLNIEKDDIKPNRTLNILMIHAKFDEVFTYDGLKESIAKRLDIAPDNIVPNRLYGSFKDGNATMLFLDDNTDHVLIAWDQDFIRTARDWLLNTFPDVMPVDVNFYVNIRAYIIFIQLTGGIVFFYLSMNFLIDKMIKINKENNKIIEISGMNIKNLFFRILLYSLIIGIPSMFIMFPILLFLPLPIAGTMIMFLFGVIFSIFIMFRKIFGETNNILFKEAIKIPFKDSKSLIVKNIIIGIISAIFLFLILYLSIGLNSYGILPSITKYPFIPVYFAFNLFAFIVISILFNMIIQPKISNDNSKDIIKSFLLQSLYLISFLSIIIVGICVISRNYFLMMVLMIAPPYLLLIAFNSAFYYKKTGNIIVGSITNTLFATFIACAFSPYINLIYILPILLL